MQTSLDDFLARLGSAEPTPGGGSVSALTGALAAALGAMVCRLTIGKPRYAEHEAAMRAALADLDRLQAELTRLIDDDIAAYEQLAAAYRLPKEPPEPREAALREALQPATEVPLRIAEAAAEVLDGLPPVVRHGSKLACSDAGMAALLAAAAIRSAALNVWINLRGYPDAGAAVEYRRRLDAALGGRAERADELYTAVTERIGT